MVVFLSKRNLFLRNVICWGGTAGHPLEGYTYQVLVFEYFYGRATSILMFSIILRYRNRLYFLLLLASISKICKKVGYSKIDLRKMISLEWRKYNGVGKREKLAQVRPIVFLILTFLYFVIKIYLLFDSVSIIILIGFRQRCLLRFSRTTWNLHL